MTFNNRQQPDHYELNKTGTTPVAIMKKNYDYLPDGRLRYVEDQLNPVFDRLVTYDHAARPKEGKTGLEARGGTVSDPIQQGGSLPYRQSYGFNAFDNLTQRNNIHWGVNANLNHTYQNNRIAGDSYDADGRDTPHGVLYDAAGRLTEAPFYDSLAAFTVRPGYDGDGRETRRSRFGSLNFCTDIYIPIPLHNIYYIRSTVLGGEVVSEAINDGAKWRGYIHAAGTVLAWTGSASAGTSYQHTDASGMSYKVTDQNGAAVPYSYAFFHNNGSPAEMDPFGSNAGAVNPYPPPQGQPCRTNYDEPIFGMNPFMADGGMTVDVDGFAMPYWMAASLLRIGAANIDFTRSNPMALGQIGIFAVQWAVGDNNAPTPPGGDPDAAYATTRYSYEYYFSGVSWVPQQQAQWEPPTVFLPNGTPCDRMADYLQRIIDLGLKHEGGEDSFLKKNHDDLDKFVKDVDKYFSEFYLGHPADTVANVADLTTMLGRGSLPDRKASGFFLGSGGFKSRFREPNGGDQTHHFAALFSLGINGHGGAAGLHSGLDTNQDRLLSAAAYPLGDSLRRQTLGDTRNLRDEGAEGRARRVIGIADRVRREICDL